MDQTREMARNIFFGTFQAGRAFSGSELTSVNECHSHHKERDRHTGLEIETAILGSTEL